MDSRETKRTVPVPSAPTDGEQPISQTTAKSIAEETAENNPQEESLEEMLRDMRRMSDPAYLHTVSMNDLYQNIYQSRPPVIDGLLYPGTYLFAGAPKVGKSFLMAQLAYHVSMGLPLWGYPVHKGTVLYLALEDDHRRLQGRLYRMFGTEGTDNLLFAVYAKQLGVNLDELYVSQPDTGEQALDIVDALVRSSAVDIVVVDSVAALTPKAEIEGDMGDSHVGLQARLMSQALRKLTAIVNKSKTCVVFINQLREKVGVMFGNPEVTPGGKALKFYASVRIDIRKTDILKDTEGAAGNRTRAKVVKNKLAPPFRQAEFDIMYGEGVSQEGCLIDLGVQYDIIKKSGAWYSYNDQKVANGREKMRQFLKDNPELAAEIEEKIRAAAKGASVDEVAGGEEA